MQNCLGAISSLHSFIYLFNTYLLKTYHVPGTVQGARDQSVNQTEIPASVELKF